MLFSMTSTIIEGMLTRFSDILQSDGFLAAHRNNGSDFTRKRCLTLPVVVIFLLQLVGGRSLQAELDSFFMAVLGRLEFTRCVTKSALSQARKKLKASAFVALNQFWVREWHEATIFELWRKLRVVAVDGTCLRLPHLRENSDRYGLGPLADGSVTMARCVALFAVASRQWLEMIVVGRYDEGERELLLKALGQILPTDILVLDRGYPAWWLFAALQVRKITFCARIEGCGWKAVERLLRSPRQEYVMCHRLKAHDRKKIKKPWSTGAREADAAPHKDRTAQWAVRGTGYVAVRRRSLSRRRFWRALSQTLGHRGRF